VVQGKIQSAAIEFEIAGTTGALEFDQVLVLGDGALGGQLELALVEFAPTRSDKFLVLSASTSLTGTFSNVSNGARLDTTDGLGSLQLNYGPGSLFNSELIVLSDFRPTLPADFDGDWDGADFLAWQLQNGSGVTSVADPQAVPEAGGEFLAMIVLLMVACRPRWAHES
jgi:hypothetical protein